MKSMKKAIALALTSLMCLSVACSSVEPTDSDLETETTASDVADEESETTNIESEEIVISEDGSYIWNLNDMTAQELYDLVIDIIHYDTADTVNGTVVNFLEPTPFGVDNANVWQGTAVIPLSVTDGDCGRYLSLLNITDDNGNVVVTTDLSVMIGFSFSDRAKAEELFELLGNYYFENYTQYQTPDTEYYMTRDLDDGGWFLDAPGGGGFYSLSLFEEDGKYQMSINLNLGFMEINGIAV